MQSNEPSDRVEFPFLRRRVKPVAAGNNSGNAARPSESAPLDLSRPAGSTSAAPILPVAERGGSSVSLDLSRPAGRVSSAQPSLGDVRVASSSPLDLSRGANRLPNASSPFAAAQQSLGSTQPSERRHGSASHDAEKVVENRLFPAPTAMNQHELNSSGPMIRLDGRQSAIGSMWISGANDLVWESAKFVTGASSADGGIFGCTIPTPGNRPLVSFHDDGAAIALRHIRLLRRVLVVSNDDSPLAMKLYGGVSIVVRPEPGHRTTLLISRVGSMLELRSDPARIGSSIESIWESFGFLMSISHPATD